jgi:glycerol-3-phosphate cytidylyltransferase
MFKKILLLVLLMSAQVYSSNDSLNPSSENDYKKNSIEIISNQVLEPIQSTNIIGEEKKPKTVITFGTFDLFHNGHLQILKRAKELSNGGKLIVGVSTDSFNLSKKNKYPIMNEDERKSIIFSIKGVDEVFDEEDMEKKKEYIEKKKADILVMGSDWQEKFDYLKPLLEVVYLPRTPDTSTTDIISTIQNGGRIPTFIDVVNPFEKPYVAHFFNKDLPLAAYQLAYDFQKIMDTYSIPFFFSSGTLLGAVRHGGMIPWDDDLDCCVLKENIDSLILNAIPELKRIGYTVKYFDYPGWRGFKVELFRDKKIVTFLDVFFMYFNEGQYRYPSDWTTLINMSMKKEDIFPLKKISFGNVEISVVNNHELFLTKNFGPNWKTHTKKYNHLFGLQDYKETPITDEEKKPAGPLGPLKDTFIMKK